MKAIKRLPGYARTILKANRREAVPPRMLTHIVTFACNARCIMCDSWKIKAKDDLHLSEIEAIYDQLPKLDFVRLSGGEPFVRKDLLDIAALVHQKLDPIVLHVTTNGFLTDRIVGFCEKRDRRIPLSLLVSIDGLKEKHNHVRGRDTAWDTAMATVRALAPRRKDLRLSLMVNQTIVDSDGVEQYRLLREELRPLGVQNNFVMAYDASATYSTERDQEATPGQIGEFTTFGDFTEKHLEELLGEVEKDLHRYPRTERLAKRYYLRGIRNRLLQGENTPNPKCVALTAHMRLYPNGDVPTCQFSSKVVGNLRRQSFEEIWSSPEIQKQRDWVRKCPGCWAECEVLPSAFYTGDIWKEWLSPTRTSQTGMIPVAQAE